MNAPFDPAAWMREFTAAGGSCELSSIESLVTTRKLFGTTREDQQRSCQLEKELTDCPGKLEAVWDLVKRQAGAAHNSGAAQ
jgi:hypothetical protein